MPKYYVDKDGDASHDAVYHVDTLSDGRYKIIRPGGDELVVDAFCPRFGRLHVLLDGKSLDYNVRIVDERFVVQLDGQVVPVHVLNGRQKRMRTAGVGGKRDRGPELISPMAGNIVAITVEVGQSVAEGETVVIVEAMKMENDLKAHHDGVVTDISVAVGEAVEVSQVLVTIEET